MSDLETKSDLEMFSQNRTHKSGTYCKWIQLEIIISHQISHTFLSLNITWFLLYKNLKRKETFLTNCNLISERCITIGAECDTKHHTNTSESVPLPPLSSPLGLWDILSPKSKKLRRRSYLQRWKRKRQRNPPLQMRLESCKMWEIVWNFLEKHHPSKVVEVQ